jgi:hypothetical protein
MKETLRRRKGYVVFKGNIRGSVWNCVDMVMRGSVNPPCPTPFYKQASGQIYKDDVKVFFLHHRILFGFMFVNSTGSYWVWKIEEKAATS